MERSHCEIKPEWCVSFQIYNHILVFQKQTIFIYPEGAFVPCVSRAALLNSRLYLKWSGNEFLYIGFCLVADCHGGVSGPGKAQEGSLPAGSG